jgi:hypothetical protein
VNQETVECDQAISVRVGELIAALHGAYCYGFVCGVVGGSGDGNIPMALEGERATPELEAYITRLAQQIFSCPEREDGTRAIPPVEGAISDPEAK